MPNKEDKQGCCDTQTKTVKATTDNCGCGCSRKNTSSIDAWRLLLAAATRTHS